MSGVLRPWLLGLAQAGLFQPIWSDRIGSEWRRNAARIWTIEPSLLEREWDTMQAQFASANVSRWTLTIEQSPPNLKYSDKKDWHVIEAGWMAKQANPGQAAGIVTLNIKDFSRSELRQLGLDLWEPDRLLSKWWETEPQRVSQHLNQTIEDLIASGRRQRAPVEDFLKRERLFRFNKLLASQSEAADRSP